jgi:hypothetical protein
MTMCRMFVQPVQLFIKLSRMNKILFERYVPSSNIKYLKDESGSPRMPLVRTRNFALFLCVLQIAADVAGIGTSVVRGQVVALVILNLLLIASAIGGFFGALKLRIILVLSHAMFSVLLFLVLLGTGIFTFVQDKTALRLVLYCPALVDLAAGITSFVLYRHHAVVERVLPSDEEIERARAARIAARQAEERAKADEAEAAAQRQRHRDFDASIAKRTGRYDSDGEEKDDDDDLSDAHSASSHSSREQQAYECAICLNAKKNTLLLPCHHCATCFECAGSFVLGKSKCPMCRATIEKVEKIYL